MHQIIQTAIWAGVWLVIAMVLLWRFGTPIRQLLEVRREQKLLANQETEIALLERRNAAELAARTMDEAAAKRQAVLREEAAEADARAEVAKQTIDDQVKEQRRIIAARAEGLAQRAQMQALKGEDAAAGLKALSEAYQAYVNEGNTGTFSYWMRGMRLEDGQVVC